MNKNIKFAFGFIAIVIFCIFYKFLSNDILWGDDTTGLISWITEGGKLNLDGIITSALSNFTAKNLPLLLHIHPHNFSMTAGAAIRAFDVVLLSFVMSLFMFSGRSKTKIFPVIFAFSAFYFCYASANIDFNWLNPNQLPSYDITGSFILLTEYSQHFGQLLTFIFGLAYLYFVITSFAQNKLPEEKYLPALTIASFFIATLSMFVNIVCGITLLFIGAYLLLINLKTDRKTFLTQGKTVYIPIFSYFCGSVLFSFYPGFLNYFSADINFLSFAKTLIKNFVLTNSFEFALILILSAILYFLALHKSTFIKRTVFSAFSAITGAFCYFAMFSTFGKSISLVMTDSQVLFRLLLISLVFLLFGACLREHTSEPKEQKIVSACFTLVLLAFSIVQAPFIYTTMKIWKTMSEETKVTSYCIEKMYRFYSLRGKTALLPEDALLKTFKISSYTNDNSVDSDEKITNRTFFKYTYFTDGYYKTFYPSSKIVAYKFIDAKKALKIFFEEGGMIAPEEIKTLNFQNLYNDKFVLNRAIEKSKYDN